MAIHAQNSVSLNTKPAKTSLLGGHFIYRVDASQGTLTPSSANIIENVNDSPTLWGYNTHIGAGGIKLRYNQIDLSTWTKDGVTLYYPKYNSSNIPIQGDAAAILNTTGLKVQKGGVIAGTAGQNGFVYLSSEDYQLKDSNHTGFTINGHTPTAAGTDDKLIDDPAWREIIGTKFGVDSEGNLYASNANISGKIIATEGEIGGCTIDSNGHLIVPSAYIDGTLTVTTIEGGVFNTNNYIRLSSEDSQTISINNSGNKTDWRIIAGNTFGVDKAGNLYATSAHVNGEIEATTGLIGGNDGWHIGTSAIYSGSHSTYNTPNVNGIFLGKESSNYYISGGPGAKWWIKDDGTFQLGTSGISYDGSTVTFGSNVTMPTLTVDTITGGTAGTNGFIYLSKNDYGSGISVGGSASKTDWKLIAGSKFGVDDEGNLYSTSANISGEITATSGTIGGCNITNGTLEIGDLNIVGTISGSKINTSTLTLSKISYSSNDYAEIGSNYFKIVEGGSQRLNLSSTGGLTFYQSDGSTPMASYTSSGATIYSGGVKRVTFGDMTSFYDDTGTHEIGRFTTTYTSGYSTFYIQSFINTYNYGAIELRSDSGDSYDRVVLTASTGTSSNTYQGSFNVAPKLVGCNLFNGAGGSSPVTGFALTPTEFQVSDGYSKTFSVTTSTGNVYCGNISPSAIPTAATVFAYSSHSFTIPAISTSGGSTGATTTSSFSKPGYYPIAIAGFQTGGSNITFVRIELTSRSSGSTKVTYNARAIGTSTSSSSASVNILWVKTS